MITEKDVTVPQVSLMPLDVKYHTAALQRVYEATPGYWQMFGLLTAPQGLAERDLEALAGEHGRNCMGILLPNEPGNVEAGAELVGIIDFRLHWPDQTVAYVGMVLVAEPFQRRRIGTAAWQLLEPWLAGEAGIQTVQLAVEQFNLPALKFFESLGFVLTGDSRRAHSGRKLVRMLYMEKVLTREP